MHRAMHRGNSHNMRALRCALPGLPCMLFLILGLANADPPAVASKSVKWQRWADCAAAYRVASEISDPDRAGFDESFDRGSVFGL
jgi:hypothetical protein